MRKWVLGIVLLLSALCVSDVSYAGYAEGNQFSAGNTNAAPAADAYGQIVRAFLNELLGGEDAVNNVFKVESRWTNIPTGTTTAMFAADFTVIMQHLSRCQQANLLDVVPASEWYAGLTNPRRRRAA